MVDCDWNDSVPKGLDWRLFLSSSKLQNVQEISIGIHQKKDKMALQTTCTE